MSKSIQSTTNYSRFELSLFNRDIRRISHLERSMRKEGWIDAYPMHVIKNGGYTLKIKAGHHRFVVAKKIGIPVKFVICEDSATIHELEKSTNSWTTKDYLDSFVRMGLSEYIIVKKYMEDTGIPLGTTISLLGGETAKSSSKLVSFKDGRYVVQDMYYPDIIKDIVLYVRESGISFAASNLFVTAISKVLRVENFSVVRFKKKISVHGHKIDKQSSVVDYLRGIEKIYNLGSNSKNKLPIAFLADQESKKRIPDSFRGIRKNP